MSESVRFSQLAIRDAALVLAALLLWWGLSGYSAGTGPVADFAGVVLGAGLGFCAYAFHEWGHIAGAWISRSVMRPGVGLKSFSNFVYDSKQNNRLQFLTMSVMGLAPTVLMVWVYYSFLPEAELATQVARGIVLFLAFLGLVLEMPLVVWALVRKDLPPIDR